MLNRTVCAPTRAQQLCETLRAADALIAEAITLLQQGVCEKETGLPTELLLSLEARLTARDARFLCQAADTLSHMPILLGWFSHGVLSWGQVRSLLWSVSGKPQSVLGVIDAAIGEHASSLSTADPDDLIGRIDDLVLSLEPKDPRKEDRAIRSSFLAIQPRLDGGSHFFGEAGPESTATLLEALDQAAAQPRHPDAGGESRAHQRFEALLAICEQSLAGKGHGTRPQPRILATYDVSNPDSLRVLTGLVGCRPRLSRVSAETLLCDATIVPVGFVGTRVVEVGDEAKTTSTKVRHALEARDKGCRFPGCHAPSSWADSHHPKRKGTTADEQYLLCRRCHRRVHLQGWKDQMHPDGTISFTRRGKQYVSAPP